jgi:hypothetical protein
MTSSPPVPLPVMFLPSPVMKSLLPRPKIRSLPAVKAIVPVLLP